MITLDVESRQAALSPIDLDMMTNQYITASGLYVLSSPDLWTIEKNLFYLLRNSTLVQFDQQYNMRPDFYSYDEYGTTQLAQLLMYINNISCTEDFNNLTQIVVPSMSAIVEILSDKIPTSKDVTTLPVVNY
jgi:hypothetical protein